MKATRRQLDVVAFMRRYHAEHDMWPSIREIADALEVSSTNGVSDHLKSLHNKGLVIHADGKSRGWRLRR